MRSILLISAMLFTQLVTAQSWSAGGRSGLASYRGYTYSTETMQDEKIWTNYWEKEIFIRYESKKRFAYEMGLAHISEQYATRYNYLCGTGIPDVAKIGQDETSHFLMFNFRVQYKVFSCPVFKRLSHSPGIAVTPALGIYQFKDVYHNTRADEYSLGSNYTFRDLSVQAAIEDRISYRISKRWDVHTLLSFRISPGQSLNYHGFGAQAGLGYHFAK